MVEHIPMSSLDKLQNLPCQTYSQVRYSNSQLSRDRQHQEMNRAFSRMRLSCWLLIKIKGNRKSVASVWLPIKIRCSIPVDMNASVRTAVAISCR